MKAADVLAARLAGNMMESMGAAPAGVPTPTREGVLHGGAAKYQGAARLKDALAMEEPEHARDDADTASE